MPLLQVLRDEVSEVHFSSVFRPQEKTLFPVPAVGNWKSTQQGVVDPQSGTLYKLMPFCQAFARNSKLSKFFAAHLSLPPSTVVTSPQFIKFVGALCCGYVYACMRTIHKIRCIV